MTVLELRRKLEGLDLKMPVVVYRMTESGGAYCEVTDVAPYTGEPFRHEKNRKADFRFESNGPATWLFITIEEA